MRQESTMPPTPRPLHPTTAASHPRQAGPPASTLSTSAITRPTPPDTASHGRLPSSAIDGLQGCEVPRRKVRLRGCLAQLKRLDIGGDSPPVGRCDPV